MSSAEAQIAYNKASPIEPQRAQEQFAQYYDLSRPEDAMTSYQKYVLSLTCFNDLRLTTLLIRLLHEHTKQQFQAANSRGTSGSNAISLNSEESTESVSSTAS